MLLGIESGYKENHKNTMFYTENEGKHKKKKKLRIENLPMKASVSGS